MQPNDDDKEKDWVDTTDTGKLFQSETECGTIELK